MVTAVSAFVPRQLLFADRPHPIPIDVVVTVAVSIQIDFRRYDGRTERHSSQTHPQQNMIASGSIDSDLTVKVWVDRGAT